MPLFVWIGCDAENAVETRTRLRPSHLERLRLHAPRIRFAGPLRDENGTPRGSVIEAESLAAARELAAGDPYATGGVFASWEVFETIQVFPDTA